MDFMPLKQSSSTSPNEKPQETDRQMLTRISKKFALILVVIFMFDTLIDWILGLIDLMLEGSHILIEAIEYSIEILLEHTLHTDHQHSEIIIVNGTILLCLYLTYRLYFLIPKLCSRFIKKCSLYAKHKSIDWHEIPLIRKAKISTVYCLGITCILFILTI